MKNSQKIQTEIKQFCDREGLFYSRLQNAGRGRPDISILYRGITFYFEIKSGSDTLRPAQRIVRKILNADVEIAFAVWSFEEFLNIWKKIIFKRYRIFLTSNGACGIRNYTGCRDCTGKGKGK